MVEQFLNRAMGRMRQTYGFDWISIIMPIVMALIQGCLENRNKLAGFVEGQRSPMQIAALKARCRQAARQAGVGMFRAWAVGDEVAASILAECDAMARQGLMGSDGSDPYQAVIDEINGVMG